MQTGIEATITETAAAINKEIDGILAMPDYYSRGVAAAVAFATKGDVQAFQLSLLTVAAAMADDMHGLDQCSTDVKHLLLSTVAALNGGAEMPHVIVTAWVADALMRSVTAQLSESPIRITHMAKLNRAKDILTSIIADIRADPFAQGTPYKERSATVREILRTVRQERAES